jgi:PAS domain S-box-containing protein
MSITPSPIILLVDDNEVNRYTVSRMLCKEGFIVTEAGSGREALRLAAADPKPNLIVLDIHLPDLSGFAVCEQLKTQPATAMIPILQLSAMYVRDEDKIQGLQGGADAYLAGPVEPPMLLATVQSLLRVRQVEIELRESQRRLLMALDAADAESFEWDITSDAVVWSPKLSAILGLEPDSIAPYYHVWRERIHPEDRSRVEATITQNLAERCGVSVEYRILRVDGTVRWVHERGHPTYSASGQPLRMAGLMMDITARKQAEAAGLRLAAIVESSDDAIISKSLDGVVVSWNTAAERLFGYSAEEMIGQSNLRLLPEDRHDEERLILARLRRGERIDHFETVRRTKDGRLVDVSISISPVRDERGTIIGASKIARDITARKHSEAALARQAAELVRVNAELQQFAYIVSHDLSEPLRTISGFLGLLTRRVEGALDGESREFVDFAVEGAARMQQMLTDLLAYTRAGGPTLEVAVVDCEALLTQVLSGLQMAITDNQATITHDPLPTVRGDGTRLGQVLQNLIGNALKFCDKEPPRVHVSAQYKSGHWQFAVRDNGIGIDLTQTKRLFQVFQRLHPRGKYSGTGIGLAICKKIIEQHGGRIWVESQPGEGATFYFTIAENQHL